MRAAKNELRQRMRATRLALSSEEVARLSALAAAHVITLPELVPARLVGLYAPIASAHELETAAIHDALRAAGKTPVYPRVRGRDRPLELHPVEDRGDLVVSALGIPQPAPTSPTVEPDAMDLFIVPGLAFGEHGERVGWGAGHYDRTLGAAPRALRVGYAFDFQLVPEVPQGADDARLDLVVTDAGVRVRRPR